MSTRNTLIAAALGLLIVIGGWLALGSGDPSRLVPEQTPVETDAEAATPAPDAQAPEAPAAEAPAAD
ncbi:MAG: hypothetical protein AAGI51_10825 [Pseudomonadota bacterium]